MPSGPAGTVMVLAGMSWALLLLALASWWQGSGAVPRGPIVAADAPSHARESKQGSDGRRSLSAPQGLARVDVSGRLFPASDAVQTGAADPSARVRPLAARKERELYEAFLVLDAAALDERVEEVLRSAGPDAEKVALLRVLLDARAPRAAEAFVFCVAQLPDASGPAGESVPRTALGLLRQRAARDPLAREILERIAWVGPPPSSRLRCLAVAAIAAHGSTAQLRRLESELINEPDPTVRASAAAALGAHANRGLAQRIRERLGADDLPPPGAATQVE